MKAFLIGLGCVAALLLMLYPELKGRRESPAARDDRHRFEREARTAQDVTATEEDEREDRRVAQRDMTDEEISARKNYQPADHWKWKYEAEEQVVCEPIEFWYGWDTVCHTYFERPIAYPRRQEPQFEEPKRPPPQRYVAGPPVFGPDGRQHRTRRMVTNVRNGGCRGGCPYYGG